MEQIYAFIDEYVNKDGELGQRLSRFGDEKHIWIKFPDTESNVLFKKFIKTTSNLFTSFQNFDPIILTGEILDEDDSNIYISIFGWEIGDFTNIKEPSISKKEFDNIIKKMETWLSFVEKEQQVILIGEKTVLSKHKYKDFKKTSTYRLQEIFALWRLNIRLKYPTKGLKKLNIIFSDKNN